MTDDVRRDLAKLASSLRAYIEWQQDAGTLGFPRRAATPAATATAPAPSVREQANDLTAHAAPPATVREQANDSTATATVASADRRVRLPQLAAEVASCTRCVLSATRTQTVFARGNPAAQLCFVGEAPTSPVRFRKVR